MAILAPKRTTTKALGSAELAPRKFKNWLAKPKNQCPAKAPGAACINDWIYDSAKCAAALRVNIDHGADAIRSAMSRDGFEGEGCSRNTGARCWSQLRVPRVGPRSVRVDQSAGLLRSQLSSDCGANVTLETPDGCTSRRTKDTVRLALVVAQPVQRVLHPHPVNFGHTGLARHSRYRLG